MINMPTLTLEREIALFGYPEDIFSSFLDRSSYYIHHWAGKIL